MRRLIIRPGAIGDCLLALPAMQHLRAEYTEIWISRPVVPLISFADRVRPLAETGIDLVGIEDVEVPAAVQATLGTFDSIVSWYGSARPEFRVALEKLGPSCIFLRALPPADYGGHATTYFSEQVGAPDQRPHLRVEPTPPCPEVVIHPFSGGERKNWPLDKYQELAASLRLDVYWTAGPEESLPEARRFEDLVALARWLVGARLYIGNDSGITHLAAALGVQTLALFGPTDPRTWAPRGGNVTVLKNEPLSDLSVEAVLEVANRLLMPASVPPREDSAQ